MTMFMPMIESNYAHFGSAKLRSSALVSNVSIFYQIIILDINMYAIQNMPFNYHFLNNIIMSINNLISTNCIKKVQQY